VAPVDLLGTPGLRCWAGMTDPLPTPADFRPEPWKAAAVPPPPPDGDLAFTCPRCRAEVREAAYGPCTPCRTVLRATLGGEGHEVAEADYVPKMNVTPNAVALKD
jgi:hypothetical protein